MKLKIAHIGDLRGMCFNIPDYQRGYRWETKQVCELLDDLLEFDNKKDKKEGEFYCLQPLVVVENNQNLITEEKVFDVIDGQQRLTTMFLIINYIFDGDAFYRLRYDRACDKTQANCFENGEIKYKELDNLKTDGIAKNPDFFYLSKAIEDIKNWFEIQQKKYPRIKNKIENVIMDMNYNVSDYPFYDSLSEKDINEKQSDVRFIWYDATDKTIDYQESISVFKRLNYGKTSLTAAELIKALLFQCDVYNSNQKPERRQVAFRMSTEWDRMEKALQNPFLWSMLAPEKKDKISNIDFILSYITSQIVANNELDIIVTPDDDDYDYIVFDKYIKNKLKSNCSYADIVSELWQKIQDVFDVVLSWYNERELYHLIGLRLTLLNPKNKKRNQKERDGYNETLSDLFMQFDKLSLKEFKAEQREIIGNLISLEKYNRNNQEGQDPLTLSDLSYGQHDIDLINILLVYNVTLCMKNSQDNQYFPFWFYQKTIPSLEHIHPQHLHDEDIDFDVRCLWYSEKCNELKKISFPIKLKNKTIENKDIENACTILNEVLLLTEAETRREDKDSVTSFNNKKKEYQANEHKYRPELEKIDELFDELAKIDETELHSIRNMALVDKDTNAALGNGLMAVKRKKLMELQKKFNETNGEQGAYTFMGTWKVFNKQFIDVKIDEEGNVDASNLLFWSKKDRDNYFEDIESIIKEYIK